MPVTNDKYDQLKIDKLKYFLTEMAAKGWPRPFEIFVDSLRVVPKTEDPKEFDNYEYYMNEDTEKIRILIYNSAATPRNDQYCFYVQQNKPEKPLNGLGDLDGIIQEKLIARDREYETKHLREEVEDLKRQLEEAEEYGEGLEKKLEEARNNKYKLGNLDLVELGGVLIQNLAVKNASVLEKIGLAGLVAPANAIEPATAEQTNASFQKKAENNAGLRPEQVQYIPVLQQLDETFEQPQLEIVMKIIGRFSEEPTTLNTVAELLNIPAPGLPQPPNGGNKTK
ncbi:MAG: hypothetical protein NVS3B8_11830 [Chitinophagaceae bacterium]